MTQQFDIVANIITKVDGAEAGINKLKNSLSKLKMPEKLENGFNKSFSNLDTIFAKYRAQVEKGFNTKGDVTAFAKTGKELDVELNKISKHLTELTGKPIDFKVKSDNIQKAEKDLTDLISKKEQLVKDTISIKVDGGAGSNTIGSLLKDFQRIAGDTKAGNAAGNALVSLGQGNFSAAINYVNQLSQSYKNLGKAKKDTFSKDTGMDMSAAIISLLGYLRQAENGFSNVESKINETNNQLQGFRAEQINDAANYVDRLGAEFADTHSSINRANGEMQEFARSTQSMAQQLGDLQQSTQYFFSLRNMINLLKRGIDDAIQSVKDLDAAMTETAVVTDFNVADMWADLPKYTSLANELGATTQGAYETMTLYYQQGLNQQQAFELGAETMKMARIAGLEYAETTDMMTAALRGFNMELNETSAKRVNDVYSELAAITASDTEELGTAMQRTASIAHSAGASFEGATAFLAQAIETTREPAENIGTAMKTIIARFQEMKKNPLEISEVDGEEVDYNKIDAALKTIGIDLKDTNGQFRDWDKVMLDISAKWNTLSQSQQRYIATVAAGSRQQSRFIAMVSNYGRTMELMEAANNSTGASDEQFGKTMDSLEAKLNKLHNAWQLFTMGIADNSMIKFAVDGATKLLTAVNKLIDTLSLGIGPVKSFFSIFTAFTGLKAMGKIANSAIGGLGGLVDPTSSFSDGLKKGFIGNQKVNMAQANAISNPIVQELRALRGVVQEAKSSNEGAYGQYNRLKESQATLGKFAGYGKDFTAEQVIGSLDGLNAANQRALVKSNIGTFDSISQAILQNYKVADESIAEGLKNGQRNLKNQAKKGVIDWKDYFDKLHNPAELAKAIDTSIGKGKFQPAADFLTKMVEQFNQSIEQEVNQKAQAYASEARRKNLAQTEKEYVLSEEQLQEDIAKETAAIRERVTKKHLSDYEQEHGLDKIRASNNTAATLLNGVGRIGGQLHQAGLGIQSFANILTNSANPALQVFGTALSSVGGLIMGLGMGISGISSTISAINGAALTEKIATGLSSALGTTISTAGVTGILAGIAALTTIAIAAYKSHIEKIKKAGEEVVTSYEEANKSVTDNLANLTQWRGEFKTLQEGVDENGYNVSLNTDDYDHYREIVDKIAEINPEIVEGYNAQGQAIITNNAALDETIAKLQQVKKDATDTYLQPESLSKLIKARNADEAYGYNLKGMYTNPTDTAVIHLGGQLKKAGISEDVLQRAGLSLSDFDSEAGRQRVVNNQQQLLEQVTGLYRKAGMQMSESLTSAFDGVSEKAAAEFEAIKPIYDNLMTMVGDQHLLSGVPADVQASFNKGVKLIARSKRSATQMQSAVKTLAGKYKQLTSQNSAYNKIHEKQVKLEKEYVRTLDPEAYKKQAEGSKGVATAYRKLATEEERAAKLAREQGKVEDELMHSNLADFYNNQARKVADVTKSNVLSIADAFNQFVTSAERASKAYETWQEKVENISGPEEGVQNYNQILDSVFEETEDENGYKHQFNTEALGRPELWLAAEDLLDGEWLKGKGTNSVVKQLKAIQPLLKEGAEGAYNLGTKLKDALTNDSNFKKEFGEYFTVEDNGDLSIKKDLSPEVMSSLAEYWKMNEDVLVASFSNASQYIKGFTLGGSAWDIRTALSTNEAGSAGIKERNIEGQKKPVTDLFVDEQTLIDAFHESGIWNQEVIGEKIDALGKEAGVFSAQRVLEDTNKKELKSEYGITADDFIKVFSPFLNSDELTTKGQELYGKDWLTETRKEQIEAATASDYNEELANLDKGVPEIASSVSNIESMLAAQLFKSGNATDFSAIDNLHKSMFGNDGIDTATQRLLHGANISQEDFTKDLEDNNKLIAAYEQTQAQLKEGMEKNDEDSQTYQQYKAAYDQVTADLAYAQKAREVAQQSSQFYDTTGIEDAAVRKNVEQILEGPFAEAFKNSQLIQKANDEQTAEYIAALAHFNPETDNLDNYDFKTDLNGLANIFGMDVDKFRELARSYGVDVDQAVEDGISSAAEQGKDASDNNAKRAGELMTRGTRQNLEEGVAKEAESGEEVDTSTYAAIAIGPHGEIAEKYKQWLSEFAGDVTEGAGTLGEKAQDAATKLKEYFDNSSKTIDGYKPPNTNGNKESNSNTTINTGNIAEGVQSGIEAIKGINTALAEQMQLQVETDDATSKLTKAKTIAEETVTAITTHATMNISVPGAQDLVKAGKAADKITKATGDKNINVTTSMDTKNVDAGLKDIKKSSAKVKVGADLSSAYTSVNTFVSSTNNRHATLNIYMNKAGSWSIGGVRLATGANNKISYHHVPQAGSLARGTKKGRVGPRNQGGLTLTGEEGYEIAWLPSENRSMILGASGPQMINLPKEAVVYNHDQSKEIMKKRKNPSAGSMWGGGQFNFSQLAKYFGGGSGSDGSGSRGSGSKGSGSKGNKDTEKIIKNAGKVVVWWDNMGRRVDATQRKADANQSRLEKVIQKMGSTAEEAGKLNAQYVKNIARIIQLNKLELKQAKAELQVLDKDKKASKASRKLTKQNDPGVNTIRFSYEVKKKKNGKTKKETKKGKEKTGKFITTDADGNYILNQAAITKVAKKNGSKAKAIAEAAGKALDDMLSKQAKAEEALEKAYDALVSTLDSIYDAFYGFEKVINETALLEQKLAHINNLRSVAEAAAEKEYAKAGAGFTSVLDAEEWGQSLERVKQALRFSSQTLVSSVEGNAKKIEGTYTAYADSLNFKSYQERFDSLTKSAEWAELTPEKRKETKGYQQYMAAQEFFKFAEEAQLDLNNFDYTDAINKLYAQNYNADMYDRIKETLDDINSKQDDYTTALQESYEGITDVFNTLKEYREYIADFEKELLSGIEEQAEAEISRLEEIDKNLSKAMKDLLDEVKRKLDERRKKEDNQKTESELSQKQQRLAMLRADTAGGHAVEIAQLEKEIADSRQDYQRSLEDQLIEKLQNQADEAEKQRQKQIELLEAQKEIAVQTDSNLEQVKLWMSDPDRYKQQIREAWLANNDYDKVGPEEQKRLEQEFDENYLKYSAYKEEIPHLEAIYAEGSESRKSIERIEQILAGTLGKGITSTGQSMMQQNSKNYQDYIAQSKITSEDYSKYTAAQSAYSKNQSDLQTQINKLADLRANPVKNSKATKKKINKLKKQQKAQEKIANDKSKSKKEREAAKKKAAQLKKQISKLDKESAYEAKVKDTQKLIKELSAKSSGLFNDMINFYEVYNASAEKANELLQAYRDETDTTNGMPVAQLYGQSAGNTEDNSFRIIKEDENSGPINVTEAQAQADKKAEKAEEKKKYNATLKKVQKDKTISGSQLKTLLKNRGGVDKTKGEVIKEIHALKGISWDEILKAAKDAKIGIEKIHSWFGDGASKAFKTSYKKIFGKKYATGGLADFTGPAWLDGTSSKPELVLNAQDTKNFMALKDVLSHVMSSADNLAAASGDAIFEINVNVDHLNNDYDVDRVVERVKKKIVQDSSYRNVTQVRKFR